MNENTIQEAILKALTNNSGGLKMTLLVTEVGFHAAGMKLPIPSVEQIDSVLAKMRDEKTIGMLTYHWDMGGLSREKVFVYTP